MQNGLSCTILVFIFCFLSIPAVAHGENVVIFLTTTGANSWTVPDDWNSASNTIEVIGSGWGDGGGPDGGGGAYSKIFNLSLTASTEVSYKIGDGGAVGGVGVDTFLCNATSNCASIDDSAVQVGAKGGQVESMVVPRHLVLVQLNIQAVMV